MQARAVPGLHPGLARYARVACVLLALVLAWQVVGVVAASTTSNLDRKSVV